MTRPAVALLGVAAVANAIPVDREGAAILPPQSNLERRQPDVLAHLVTFNAHGEYATDLFELPPGVSVLVPHREGLKQPYTTPGTTTDQTFEEMLYGPGGKVNFRLPGTFHAAGAPSGWHLYRSGEKVPNTKYSPFGAGDPAAMASSTCETIAESHAPYNSVPMKDWFQGKKKAWGPLITPTSKAPHPALKYPPLSGHTHAKLKVCGPTTLKEIAHTIHDRLREARTLYGHLIRDDGVLFSEWSMMLPAPGDPVVLLPFACNALGGGDNVALKLMAPSSAQPHLNDVVRQLLAEDRYSYDAYFAPMRMRHVWMYETDDGAGKEVMGGKYAGFADAIEHGYQHIRHAMLSTHSSFDVKMPGGDTYAIRLYVAKTPTLWPQGLQTNKKTGSSRQIWRKPAEEYRWDWQSDDGKKWHRMMMRTNGLAEACERNFRVGRSEFTVVTPGGARYDFALRLNKVRDLFGPVHGTQTRKREPLARDSSRLIRRIEM